MAKKKEIILVAGLGYGDESKGSIVDHLVRTRGAQLVVRYNGGAQAGHRVVAPDGRDHVFSQFGSGTFVPGVRTFLSRFMLVNPLSMMKEEKHLQSLGISDAFRRTSIDGNALVTTPFQVSANRLIEIRRSGGRHGSCGMGIGRTIEDFLKYGDLVLFAKDLSDPALTEKKLKFIQKRNQEAVRDLIPFLPATETVEWELSLLGDAYYPCELAEHFRDFAGLVNIAGKSHLRELFEESPAVVFEGAQGALLDRTRGFWPYVTKTDISFANAYSILESVRCEGNLTRIGVIRGYLTRHGRGPFVTEDEALGGKFAEVSNVENPWQEKFRLGWFDLLAIRYGLEIVGGVDCIALACLDQLTGLDAIKICLSYEYEGDPQVLEPYFDWEAAAGNKFRISGFKKPLPANMGSDRLARILLECRPGETAEFPAWEKDIGKIKTLEELPAEARKCIDFLKSKEGLDVPIKIISVSPTAEGKIEI